MNYSAPRWQPITILPQLAHALDEQAASAKAQVGNLSQCLDKPHVLDDATVERVQAVFREQQHFVPIYREQIKRWQMEATTDAQRQELARLTDVAEEWGLAVDEVLRLTEELAKGTIDTILSMSDADLGMAFLQGKIKPPRP